MHTSRDLMRNIRKGFDIVSGYKHKPIPKDCKLSLEELRKQGYLMDEAQWLQVDVIYIFAVIWLTAWSAFFS